MILKRTVFSPGTKPQTTPVKALIRQLSVNVECDPREILRIFTNTTNRLLFLLQNELRHSQKQRKIGDTYELRNVQKKTPSLIETKTCCIKQIVSNKIAVNTGSFRRTSSAACHRFKSELKKLHYSILHNARANEQNELRRVRPANATRSEKLSDLMQFS